jgi:hypothetical protein
MLEKFDCINECIFSAIFANVVAYVYTSYLCWNAMTFTFFGDVWVYWFLICDVSANTFLCSHVV